MVIASTGEPYIGIDALRTNQYGVYTQEKNGIRCGSDDVLLIWDGAHAGTVGTGLSGFVGSTIVKVLSDNSLDNKFLFYLLKLSQEKIRAAAQGAAIPHLSKAFVNSVKIPLPPLAIQRQIVEQLDKIAEAQKLNDGLIQKSDELFHSLLHKELNPVRDSKHSNGVNPAGPAAAKAMTGKKDWEVKKLGEACEKTDQGQPKKFFEKEFRYIDISSINAEAKEIQNANLIMVDVASSRARKIVRAGDIVFATTRPYLENIAIVPTEFDSAIASTGFCVIRANAKIAYPEFLYFTVISKPFIKKVLPFQRGANYPAVSDKDIFGIKILLPSLETQSKLSPNFPRFRITKNSFLSKNQNSKSFSHQFYQNQ